LITPEFAVPTNGSAWFCCLFTQNRNVTIERETELWRTLGSWGSTNRLGRACDWG